MNADRLLAHYEKVADAPDAIPRLRHFILDLVVRGKLVEQDPNDEPASELLTRIAKEKARLVKTKRIKKSEVNPINEEVAPFNVPVLWRWTRLGTIGDWGAGSTPSRGNPDLYGGRFTWLKSGELNDNTQLRGSEETVTELAVQKGSFRINRPGDVLIAMYGATIGKLAILAEAAVTNQAVCGCTPFEGVFNKYLFLFLLSQRENFYAASEGGAQPNISKVKIVRRPFPLPPLAEQRRIVAKVDELMALCDRLEAARTERESTRDRLGGAVLSRLNAPDPDPAIFRNHAGFALENLAPLTAHPNQIKALRQTILSLAVRGKLVEQDPNDEPAAELVKRIAADKARLVKARKIKKTSLESPIFPNNTPFSLPTGWAWSTLGWICSKTGSGSTPRGGKKAYKPSGVVFLRSQNVHDYGLRLSDAAYIDRATHERMSGTAIETSDLLLNITGGSIGRCCLVPDGLGEANISQHVAIIRTAINGPQHFMRCVVLSPYFQDFISNEQTGAGRGGLPKNKMDRIPVPLPPLAEQHRIVARVDELMVLCDRLESSLAAADTTRHHFLESLLQDVLEPAADQFATVRRI